MGNMGYSFMVSAESSFLIQPLYNFRIPGIDYDFAITTTHVAMVIITVLLLSLAILVRIKIRNVKPTDTPGAVQNIAELAYEMLFNMIQGIMGKHAPRFANYMCTLFIFLIVSNLSGLFGLRPPTADYGVTLMLGLITFCMIQFNGIKTNGFGHFTALFQPIWFLFPINVIGEIATPISLSLRLFGNVMSGTVLVGLVYDLLNPYTLGYSAFLHFYFDVFSGCIQAYVFCMLTMVFVNNNLSED